MRLAFVTPRCLDTFYEKVCCQKGSSVLSRQTLVSGASTSENHHPKVCSNLPFPAWPQYPVMRRLASFRRRSGTQMPLSCRCCSDVACFSFGKCKTRWDDLSIIAWKMIRTCGGLKQLTGVISQLRGDRTPEGVTGGRAPLPSPVAVGRIPLLAFCWTEGLGSFVTLGSRFPAGPGLMGLPHTSTRIVKVFKARKHQNSPVLGK